MNDFLFSPQLIVFRIFLIYFTCIRNNCIALVDNISDQRAYLTDGHLKTINYKKVFHLPPKQSKLQEMFLVYTKQYIPELLSPFNIIKTNNC